MALRSPAYIRALAEPRRSLALQDLLRAKQLWTLALGRLGWPSTSQSSRRVSQPDPVAGIVAQDRGEDRPGDQRHDAERALAREESAGQQDRLAGDRHAQALR